MITIAALFTMVSRQIEHKGGEVDAQDQHHRGGHVKVKTPGGYLSVTLEGPQVTVEYTIDGVQSTFRAPVSSDPVAVRDAIAAAWEDPTGGKWEGEPVTSRHPVMAGGELPPLPFPGLSPQEEAPQGFVVGEVPAPARQVYVIGTSELEARLAAEAFAPASVDLAPPSGAVLADAAPPAPDYVTSEEEALADVRGGDAPEALPIVGTPDPDPTPVRPDSAVPPPPEEEPPAPAKPAAGGGGKKRGRSL